MTQMNTEIEPPLPDLDDAGGGGNDEPALSLVVVLREADDTGRSTYQDIPADASNDVIADAWVRGMLATADLRGPALAAAVKKRMRSV